MCECRLYAIEHPFWGIKNSSTPYIYVMCKFNRIFFFMKLPIGSLFFLFSCNSNSKPTLDYSGLNYDSGRITIFTWDTSNSRFPNNSDPLPLTQNDVQLVDSLIRHAVDSFNESQKNQMSKLIERYRHAVTDSNFFLLDPAHFKIEYVPTFKGGLDELKKYFLSNPLTDTKAKDIVFRVHIGFVVNCSGQFGNFQIISKGKGDMQILAQQVLAIAEKMPQYWQAATVDNKTVDSYQILSFTVVGGALDKVSYR